jgi:hypothetical protein
MPLHLTDQTNLTTRNPDKVAGTRFYGNELNNDQE